MIPNARRSRAPESAIVEATASAAGRTHGDHRHDGRCRWSAQNRWCRIILLEGVWNGTVAGDRDRDWGEEEVGVS